MASDRHQAGVSGPLPIAVYEAAVRVCGESLHWKNTLRKLFVRAGVKEQAFERYRTLSKFVIARSVLDDLERVGQKGWTVQRRFVAELANLQKPEPEVPDLGRGLEALHELRRVAQVEHILVNPEDDARKRRREEAADRLASRSTRDKLLSDLNDRFSDLLKHEDRQQRGFALEGLLADLFRLSELDYSGSYKTETDQIDGSVTIDSFTYLVEARWRSSLASDADLGAFQHKVRRRLDATRGVFVSMAGFRDEAVDLYRLARENPLILVDGQDLAWILEGRVDLIDGLHAKIRAAAVRGEPYFRLSEM
jgi:hypothetical protein